MAYDTLNPVPSTDPRDLYDNAGITDKYVNGTEPFVPDRLGVQRRTWKGMEVDFSNAQEGRAAEFATALAAIGFTWIGDYGVGLSFTTRQQYTVRDGSHYTVADTTTLPYTSTGNWEVEHVKFKLVSGVGIIRAYVNDDGHLIVEYTDGSSLDAGLVIGGDGAQGVGVSAVILDGNNHLIISYTDGTTADAGQVPTGVSGVNNVRLTGTTINQFLVAGNGTTPNANSVSGDPQHWLEITNNPGNDTAPGQQLFRINSYGALGYGGNVHFCRYRGTEAAPTAIKSGDFIQSVGYRGWNGSALAQSAAAFQVVANEDWTPTANGVRFQFQNVANGGSARSDSLIIDGANIVSYRQIGFGIVPTTWNANYKVLEGGMRGCAVRTHTSTPEITLSSNLYYDTGYKYGSGSAWQGGVYQITNGTHVWSGAPVGNSGAAATMTEIARLSNVTGTGYNAAASALKVNKDASTNRSINAAGTVNAAGADYAEYMRKADDCGTIEKGQIVGITASGEVTDIWSAAVTFMIKSTDPSYVGGDTWSRTLGDAPASPSTDADDNTWGEYLRDVEGFQARVEDERLKHDRIAFAGQVPVNVQAATPGDYIVPIERAGGIDGVAISAPSFEQYRSAVGRVIAISEDGRPVVIVKAA